MKYRLLYLFSAALLSIGSLQAQRQDIYEKYNIYRNPARLFLNKFSFTLTSGYGLTVYSHDLEGYQFYQDQDVQMILSKDAVIDDIRDDITSYMNWLNRVNENSTGEVDPYDVPRHPLENPINNPAIAHYRYLVDTDSIGLGFKGYMPTIPINFSIHYNASKIRVGLGFQYERQIMKPLDPKTDHPIIRAYQPNFDKTRNLKWYALLGYQFYDWWDYTFAVDTQFGLVLRGKEFDRSAIGIGQKFFGNIGVSIEKNFSEYFRLVVRPSYEYKRYVINIPDPSYIKHYNGAWMVQVGLSFNIPEIPRSPIKSDHVQLKHVITDPSSGQLMEVRGQPFWKKQNPKIGENHRRLWRYKLKNRRKIAPY